MRIAAIAVALVAAVVARDACAQTTIGAAAGASRQEAGASDLPTLGPGFGGTSAALVALIDFRLGGRFTVGGEGSLASAITADQSQRTSSATNAFTSRHRDSVFSGVLKVGTPRARTLHAAFAIGGGYAYRRTSREGTTAPLLPPSTRSPYSAIVSDFVPALTLGGDVDVRLTDRIRILALARWYRLHDSDLQSDGTVKRGVSSEIFRAGAGVLWRWR